MDRSLNRCTFAIIGIAATIAASGQTEAPSVTKDAAGQAAYGYAAPAREAYQGAWSATSALQDAALWKSLCAARPADVGAQLNWFRSERNARLATNNGSLTDGDAAELDRIAATIQRTAPGSFEHHLSTYYLRFPDPAAGEALNQARALAKAAHEGTDWSADEKRQAAEAIETWLPKLVQLDIKDERKKLKLSALKGQ